jgi:hypothetical protein
VFTESEIAQLQFIARAQDLGFSLAEIKELAALKSENGRACPEVRGLIHRKLQNVRQKIAALKQLESELARGLRSCDGALKRPANTEQGCPVIQEIVTAPPYDPQHFVRVDETVTLTLNGLAPHTLATVSFDLCVLKSWDGNNPNYGPDRWTVSVRGGDPPAEHHVFQQSEDRRLRLEPAELPDREQQLPDGRSRGEHVGIHLLRRQYLLPDLHLCTHGRHAAARLFQQLVRRQGNRG